MRVHDPAHSRFLKLMFAATLAVCAFANAMHRSAPAQAGQASFELPTEWDGHPLRPLALGAVEQRFASQFPGQIARLTDGEQVLVWREVQRPTRMLHPAADCYRGLGYRIDDAKLERDSQERLWRCFVATQAGQRLRVCERIVDAKGQAFTDASNWFWAAQLGQSTGPWQAVTTARIM
jgi:hypothetical protein